MSLTMQTPEEAAEQAMTRDGYSQIVITWRRDIPVDGLPDETASWLISGTAVYKDGKRYRVTVHVKRTFGGIYGDVTQQGAEIG